MNNFYFLCYPDDNFVRILNTYSQQIKRLYPIAKTENINKAHLFTLSEASFYILNYPELGLLPTPLLLDFE